MLQISTDFKLVPGGAINLNVHFHSLFLDGIFTEKNGKPHFVSVFPPTDKEIVALVHRMNLRISRYLEKDLVKFSVVFPKSVAPTLIRLRVSGQAYPAPRLASV